MKMDIAPSNWNVSTMYKIKKAFQTKKSQRNVFISTVNSSILLPIACFSVLFLQTSEM